MPNSSAVKKLVSFKLTGDYYKILFLFFINILLIKNIFKFYLALFYLSASSNHQTVLALLFSVGEPI